MAEHLEMNKRRTTLPDGRYLIYYTFGDEKPPTPDEKPIDVAQAQPAPEAEEERRV